MQTKKTLFGIGIPGLGISIAYASFSTISAHFTGDTAPIKHARFQIPALTDTEKAALQEQHKEQLAQQLAQQLAEGNSTPQQYDEMLTHLET
ncbi:MAG: hypothetical protein LBG52_08565 [Candidatus Peribacteria bacterium]|nr:hypothetical protein [Candidatus Peribacteria bacterium]